MVNRGTLWFWGITAVTGLGIWAIHNTQVEEREKLHKGVIRDEELYRAKKEQLRAGQLQPAPAVALPQRQ